MKVKHNMFSLFGTMGIYEALATVLLPAWCFRNIHPAEVLYTGNSCREKLQIRYANLRV